MRAHFTKDDNGKIWLHYVKNLIVRKMYKEPGYVITKELDYLTKKGRSTINKDIKEYTAHQSKPHNNLTKTMEVAFGNYYSNMVETNDLYPSTDSSTENNQNEQAIKILRPKTDKDFKQYLKSNHDQSRQPKIKKMRKSQSEVKMIKYEDINVTRKTMFDNVHSKKAVKVNYQSHFKKATKTIPYDLDKFFPKKLRISKKLKPSRIYGVSNNIKPN
jgi:hypothetical protein